MKNIVILISGGGSNMAAIVRAAQQQEWRRRYGAQVASVVSNRADAAGLAFAREHDIGTAVVDHRGYPSREAFDTELAATIDRWQPHLVVLAGFMRILTPAFVGRYQGRLLNIHPSLLPAFPGVRAIEQAVEYGVKVFGVTVHFVDEGIDTGAIIAQRAIELPDVADPRAVRAALQPLEHDLLASVVLAPARAAVTRSEPGGRRVRVVS